MTKCVNCDECMHRSEICLCDISTNEEDCPLLNLEKDFKYAIIHQMGELDFFSDLYDIGITLEDIKNYAPKYYEYSKIFMTEHGFV